MQWVTPHWAASELGVASASLIKTLFSERERLHWRTFREHPDTGRAAGLVASGNTRRKVLKYRGPNPDDADHNKRNQDCDRCSCRSLMLQLLSPSEFETATIPL